MKNKNSSEADPGDSISGRFSLDSGWLFHLGDIAFPEITGHGPTYSNAKAGKAWGAADPEFDDTDWRPLDLPHDWVVEGPFDVRENLSQGYRPRGIAWYRRHFRLDEADKGKHIALQFDGISSHATVWVNGLVVHRSFCGYTPFEVDLTPIVNFAEQINTIVVRVDANAMEGWWYEGGGIYRHTWLVKRAAVHIPTYGVYAVPVRAVDGTWSIPVEIDLESIETEDAEVEVRAELLDPQGNIVISGTGSAMVPALDSAQAQISLSVPVAPQLWSVDSPVLYSLRVSLARGGEVRDQATVPCGFRTIRFDADEGFFLNDQPLKIQGTCNHQDHAGVGVAVPDALWDFRVRRLKEMGSNAYRAAHNPPAPEFLDACDRLGLLVMDENRHFNHTPEYLSQLRTMVKRDRNHPSIILWSVFNEEPMQGTAQGREMVRRMAAEVRRWDKTRSVTAAMNGGMGGSEGVFEAVDVMGFNYCDHSYDSFHSRHPKLPMLSSEDTCTFMTRGEFETDVQRNVISSYDEEFATWGRSHREAWRLIAERPFLAGGFVWTGFDYRGEPQRLVWPSVSSVFGIMDVCGFPKAAFFIHQADWIRDRPVLEIQPHWTWPGREGEAVRVIVMTNAESVALFLNGTPLGQKDRPAFNYIEWEVAYQPGCLEAVAYRGGVEVARTAVETSGKPAALRLTPDRNNLQGDGLDALPVTVTVVDVEGRLVPEADNLVAFTVSGSAENIGHGNGDHNCHDPEHGPTRRVFHGMAQLIVRSRIGSGLATIRAESAGLLPAEATLEVRSVPVPPAIPAAEHFFSIVNWRVSPPQGTRPDPDAEMSEADMNTWMNANPGSLQTAASGEWLLYRAVFTPWERIAASGGEIVFGCLHGQAEIWLDGHKVFEKTNPAPATLRIPIPPAPDQRVLTLLVQPDANGQAGLSLPVTIEMAFSARA